MTMVAPWQGAASVTRILKPYLHRTSATRAMRATGATQFFFIISALGTSVKISNVATVDLAEPGCLAGH